MSESAKPNAQPPDDSIVERARAWSRTKEGREAIERAIMAAAQLAEDFRKSRQVSEELMRTPFSSSDAMKADVESGLRVVKAPPGRPFQLKTGLKELPPMR